MRTVLGSNVLLAAFAAPRGRCAELYRVLVDRHRIVLSEHILAEVRRHLPRLSKNDPAEIDAAMGLLRRVSEIVEPADVPPGACRDPDDLPILGTLLAAGADCLVTGDADLLELREFEGIPILSPRGFYQRLP